jgi:hypothetical protein
LPTSDSLGDLKRDLQQLEQSNWSCVSAGTSPFCGQVMVRVFWKIKVKAQPPIVTR